MAPPWRWGPDLEEDRSSRTAEYVAAFRGLGVMLPPEGRLVDDPWGAEWTRTAGLRRLAQAAPRVARWLGRPARYWLVSMQVRTYALDQAIESFARDGGRQLLLLGAGYDARALRLERLGLRVFEVDHPATQARKRPLIGGAATLVPWDFERRPLRELPAHLAAQGHAAGERTCVVWEGVTTYLSQQAIEDSFAMLRELLSSGSMLAFTYLELQKILRPSLGSRLTRRLVARSGEPWRFGWDPAELPSWLEARELKLQSDGELAELGARWLPPGLAKRLRHDGRHVAVAIRA